MRKFRSVAVFTLMLLFSFPAYGFADMISEIVAAERTLGINNSDKKAIQRIEILEEELGLSGGDAALADRLIKIQTELGIASEELENLSETTIPGLELAMAPSDEFIMEHLQLVDSIEDMAAATEDHDPNGGLSKPDGYKGCVFFIDSQVR